MSRYPIGGCPFCGVPSQVPHESQEGCIAALHAEIGRMRGILAHLKPAGVREHLTDSDQGQPSSVRLSLTKPDLH
jgi:hypothetical protein